MTDLSHTSVANVHCIEIQDFSSGHIFLPRTHPIFSGSHPTLFFQTDFSQLNTITMLVNLDGRTYEIEGGIFSFNEMIAANMDLDDEGLGTLVRALVTLEIGQEYDDFDPNAPTVTRIS